MGQEFFGVANEEIHSGFNRNGVIFKNATITTSEKGSANIIQ